MTEPTILLAALEGGSGDHVQVGNPMSHDGAYTLWEILDGDLGTIHGRGHRRHYIHGEPVSFYRLRGEHPLDINPIMKVPVGHIRRGRRADSNA